MAATPVHCGFEGNPDLYGLGIRLGIYAQVVSTLVTNHFLPGELSSTWTANIIFVAALIVALVKSISQPADFFAVEAFVLLQLILLFFLAVISASGGLFVLCDYFCTYLDGRWDVTVIHVLAGASSEAEQRARASRLLSKLGRAYSDGSPLRYTLRLVLSLATSSLNLWFWISGVRTLEHEGPGCPTDVFLFAPVAATGPVRTLFIVAASLYAAYHALLLGASLVAAEPESVGSVKARLLAAFDPRSPTERARSGRDKAPLSDELHPPPPRKQTAVSRKIHVWLHTAMIMWSSAISVYSLLAVELTLQWNHVRGVYTVSSTGQLIPLFIGLVGLVRASLSALLEHTGRWRKKSKAAPVPSIVLHPDTGVYHYWVPPSHGQAQKIAFKARRPARRWSDVALADADADTPTVERAREYEAPLPVLPVRPSWEDHRLKREVTAHRSPALRIAGSSRFLYTDRTGHRHVFHDGRLLRRASVHEGMRYLLEIPLPHRARDAFHTPLRDRRRVAQQQKMRHLWWDRKLTHLERQRRSKKHTAIPDLSSERWQRFVRDDHGGGSDDDDDANDGALEARARRSSVSSVASGPPWLPVDVDDETLLWMTSYGDTDPCRRPRRSSREFHRSNSLEGGMRTYEGIGGHHMPFLRHARPERRSSSVLASTRSSSPSREERRWASFDRPVSTAGDSSNSSMIYVRRESMTFSTPRSGSRSSRSRSPSFRRSCGRTGRVVRLIVGFIALGVLALLNIFCLCSPCFTLKRMFQSVRLRWQSYRYGRRVQKNAKPGPVRASAGLYFCPECDADLQASDPTRDWYTVSPPKRTPTLARRLRRVMEEHIGLPYTKRALAVVLQSTLRALGRFEWSRDLVGLAMDRMDPTMAAIEALAALDREQLARLAESASSPV